MKIKNFFLIAFLTLLLFNFGCGDSKKQIVFLCGEDKAWNLFEAYLKKLDDEKRTYKLGDIVVKIWDGKEFKEVSIKWTDYLSGEGVKVVWQKKLSKIDTKCDPDSFAKAQQYGWEIYPSEPFKKPEPVPPTPPQPEPQPPTPPQPDKKPEPSTKQPPTEAKLNLQQGINYMKAKDYENAIKEFTLAIEKFPDYDVAYSNRAVAYMQQKKFNKALDDLKKAEQINPNNPIVHYNFVALYSLQKQLDRALDHLDKALQLGFNNYDALRTDPDLENVRKHPEFRKILEKHKVFIAK